MITSAPAAQKMGSGQFGRFSLAGIQQKEQG